MKIYSKARLMLRLSLVFVFFAFIIESVFVGIIGMIIMFLAYHALRCPKCGKKYCIATIKTGPYAARSHSLKLIFTNKPIGCVNCGAIEESEN